MFCIRVNGDSKAGSLRLLALTFRGEFIDWITARMADRFMGKITSKKPVK
jgi:hypothetical protein